MKIFSTIAANIANFIYPSFCGVCKKALSASNNTGVCGVCTRGIKRHPQPYCSSCGRTLDSSHVGACGASSGRTVQHHDSLCADCRAKKPAFAAARSVCLYEGPVKELIHLFKYKNKRSLAGLFAGYMIDFIDSDDALATGVDTVTFVPLHRKRLRERDFNQSGMIGRLIAAELALPFADCLEKIKQTANQNELSRRERLENLKGAFRTREGRAKHFRGCTILLVDDVMTTGATLDECARTLLQAGAKEVRCLTLARGR